MPPPLQPCVRFVFRLEPFPVADAIIYKWSHEALPDAPDAGGANFTEGRVIANGWGDLEHMLSTIDGHYAGATLTIELNDSDLELSTILGGPTTEFWLNRQGTLELLSTIGRAQSLAWRPLLHGRVSDAQPVSGRKLHLEIRDLISSQFNTLSLDAPICRTLLRPENHYGLPVDLYDQPYPLIIGEHTDLGTVNLLGEDGAIGAVPLKFIGYQMLMADGSLAPDGSEQQFAIMQPPTNIRATVFGTPGTRRVVYSVSAIVQGYGETAQSQYVVINNAPNVGSPTDYVLIEWDPPPEYGQYVSGYRVHGRGAIPPNRFITVRNNNGAWTNPEESYEDHGTEAERLPIAPVVGTAQAFIPIAGSYMSGWGRMLVSLGATRPTALYASDLGGDPNNETLNPPRRVRIPFDHPDVIAPYLEDGSPEPRWPFPDRWVERNGIRFTIIGMRGPMLHHHLDNTVTAAVNVCGYDASGNQTGPMVDDPGEALKLFINEFFLKNNGEGYRNGAFGPLQLFPDGVSILKTSTFEAFDDLHHLWCAPNRWTAAWYIDDPNLTWREFFQRYCQTFGAYVGAEQYGQIVLHMPDDPTDTGTERMIRQNIEIVTRELPPVVIAHNEIQTRRAFQFHWVPDRQDWRNPVEVVQNEDARQAYRLAHRPGNDQVVGLYCTNDRFTALDTQGRILSRRSYAPLYQDFPMGMEGQEIKLGQEIRAYHDGGGKGGYFNTPFFITKRRYNINKSMVTLTGLNLARYATIGAAGPAFQETGMEFLETGSEFR